MMLGKGEKSEPPSKDSFLQLCAELGLYNAATWWPNLAEDEAKCELPLGHTEYQGSLIFYKKDGQVSTNQPDVYKKTALWQLLAPWTTMCQKRTNKRKRGQKLFQDGVWHAV